MSNAGSTRSHGDSRRGRDHRRSSNKQVVPEDTISVFQGHSTPTVGSSRRHRGYQPDEVNKKLEKLETKDSANLQGEGNAENLTVATNLPEASTTNKLASTLTPISDELLPPHRRPKQVRDRKTNNQPPIPTQVATMDASRPELDLVHFRDVSKVNESEVSSIEIITERTERKPSCWSIASPPEDPPTEWNSAAANIDRPARTTLPIYRFPKPENKAIRQTVSSPFNRQQAMLKAQATESASKVPKHHEIQLSSSSATSREDEDQATPDVASRKDRHIADSVQKQFQQIGLDERLNAEEASMVKAIQNEVLSGTMQTLPEVQLESNELKTSSTTQKTPQAKLTDVEQTTSIASSAVASQAKFDQVSAPPGKENGVTPPHLGVQPASMERTELHNKTKPIPPHLKGSVSSIMTTAKKTTAINRDPERGGNMVSAMQVKKLPPHLQSLSKTTAQATEGPLSFTTPPVQSQKKDDSYRPTIDIDEEIAATQPILDIDEEIVAGIRADTDDTIAVAQCTGSNAQEANEQILYVPPHTGASFSRSKASAAESKPKLNGKATKSQVDVRTHSTNTKSGTFAVGPYAAALQDVTGERKNANKTFPSQNRAVPDGAESSVKKGKKPAREFGVADDTSDLVGWDSKMKSPPVGDMWDGRKPFSPRSDERSSVIEAWRKEHAADPEDTNRAVVNTASADFQTGEGLAGGDSHVLSPIDEKDHETRAPNDDFTQARRHQNAAEAIKHYEAKIAAKPKPVLSGIDAMTREQKRSLRRALIEEERTRVLPPNPHAPAANIYLRPAEFKDMGQVTRIDNYYVRETNFVLHLDPVDELHWRSRLQEAENEKNPFIVAIHMGEKSCRHQEDIIRKKQENVVGFAVAADLGNKQTMYHSSVELELVVHPDFYHQGIGRTLLDRILAALSPDHNLLECAPFLSHNESTHWIRGGTRQAKAIIVNIHYSDGEEDIVTWRKQWLAKHEFQHIGTLPLVGFKKGKLVNTCQLVLNTSVRL